MIFDLVREAIATFKCEDVTEHNLENTKYMAKYVFIASATSTVRARSTIEKMYTKLKQAGFVDCGIDVADGEWCVLDGGEFMVHVFTHEKRAHYRLDELLEKIISMSRDS